MNNGEGGIEKVETKVEKADLIKALAEKGLSDPETQEMLTRWTEEQEKYVESQPRPDAEIKFNIDRADLYIALNDVTGALECLEDARVQASQESRDDLYNQICDKMDEIEK